MRSSVDRVKGLVGKGLKGAAKATVKGLLGQTPSLALSSTSSSHHTHGAVLVNSTTTSDSADGHAFVDAVIKRCERAWAILCGRNYDNASASNENVDAALPGDGSSLPGLQQDHAGAIWDAEKIMVATGNVVPFRARELLWSEVVQVY
jgi:hypothetical protein